MMTAIALVACLYALVLAKHAAGMEEELRIERRLREQAEQREDETLVQMRNVQRNYWRLARKKAMHFAGQPTLDATAYRAEDNPRMVWWTYDS